MREYFILIFSILGFLVGMSVVSAATFEINGTTSDVNGTALAGSNITVNIKNQNWADLGSNTTLSNATGWFNLSVLMHPNNMYQLVITHNDSSGSIDYVGQSLPTFPYGEFSRLTDVNYYLREGGTMNITAINSTGNIIQFSYQVKDTNLGYPVASSSSGAAGVIVYVQRDSNYSIMIYPPQGSTTNFVPVSFEWSNFTATQDYAIGSLSKYNATTKTLHKQFNVTESPARISGYLNSSEFNISGWEELTILPFLSEPGNMIFMTYGILPFNASAWFQPTYTTDVYNLTRRDVNASGFYNITIPYASTETVKYILFAAAKNGTYYGAYRNITVTGNAEINFTMHGLLGSNSTINMNDGGAGGGATRVVNTTRQFFQLINTTNHTLSNLNAHTETTVDYSNYGAIQFSFMEDISQTNTGNFSLPLLNVTGFKEMNIYSMSYAPKRVSTRTAAQIKADNNITMKAFDPGEIPGQTAIAAASISINIYKSNSTCDVPNPPSGCSLTASSDMSTFNPFKSVMGGGKISFRMGMGGVLVHYVNVNMLASGPPDAMFEDNAGITEHKATGFDKAMRFGSNGPTIYDYVLVSMPYTEGSSSTTGLNENAVVNMSIPAFYDENWNVAWNTSLNGTNANWFAGNDTHYSTYQSDWQTLMGNNTCQVTTTGTSAINATYPCHIDTTNNRIWIRLPHFSGTGPSMTGSVITASSSSTSSSSSGGSSGSAGSTTAGAKLTKKYSSVAPLAPKTIVAADLASTKTMLTEIYFDVKERVLAVEISVEKLTEQPANTVAVPESVYTYVSINKTALEDSNIASAYIKFKVEKSWITKNNIDSSTIALYRYANSQWNKLTTQQTDSDSSYLYFKAAISGFSYFAIMAHAVPTATTTTTTAIATTTTTLPPVIQPPAPESKMWLIAIVLVVMILIFILFYFLRTGSKKSKRE